MTEPAASDSSSLGQSGQLLQLLAFLWNFSLSFEMKTPAFAAENSSYYGWIEHRIALLSLR